MWELEILRDERKICKNGSYGRCYNNNAKNFLKNKKRTVQQIKQIIKWIC